MAYVALSHVVITEDVCCHDINWTVTLLGSYVPTWPKHKHMIHIPLVYHPIQCSHSTSLCDDNTAAYHADWHLWRPRGVLILYSQIAACHAGLRFKLIPSLLLHNVFRPPSPRCVQHTRFQYGNCRGNWQPYVVNWYRPGSRADCRVRTHTFYSQVLAHCSRVSHRFTITCQSTSRTELHQVMMPVHRGLQKEFVTERSPEIL